MLWSQRYDRELKDVFFIQDEIAESIARILRLATERPARRSRPASPTGRIEAYEFYLRGRRHFYRATREDLEAARRMFARAVEIDPGYTRAYAGLADSCCFLYQTFARDAALLEEADLTIGRALALDAESAEAHTSRGVLFSSGDVPRRRSRSSRRRSGSRLTCSSRTTSTACPAIAPAPWSGLPGSSSGPPRCTPTTTSRRSSSAAFSAGWASGRRRRRFRRGLTLAERQLQRRPDDVRARYLGAAALVALGQAASGLAWARAVIAQAPGDIMTLYNVAGIFATAGQTDEALDHLEALVGAGFVHRGALENDPDLVSLRTHPRYRSIVDGLAQPSRHLPDPRSS